MTTTSTRQRRTHEQPPVADAMHHRFEDCLARYGEAEAALRAARPHPRAAREAAVARRDEARRAVVLARPVGVTTLEVARRLRAAAAPCAESARSW